jgi:16S rRNA G966 N2-methylase RsmD
MAYIVQQIEALRKLRDKAPSWVDPDLRLPPALSIEQASSEATARYKAALFSGRRMADLTGGLGMDAFHFARQFGQVYYVEQQAELVEPARHNFAVKGQTNIECVAATAEEFLNAGQESFDLLYLDPARRDDRRQKVFRLQDCSPDVTALIPLLLEKSPKVLIKTAPLLDLKAGVADLKQVSRIWVLALRDEVKEVLYLLERAALAPSDVPVTAVNLGSGQPDFAFTMREESASEALIGPVQQWLYEPNAAILKAGAFRSFAARYGLTKLHPNTHLYTSADKVAGVPGRCFRVLGLSKYDKKAVRALLPEPRGNVTTRNFPDGAAAVRKKLELADGGDRYLFATTTGQGLQVVVCEKG